MTGAPPKTLLIHVHNRKRIQFNLSGIYPMLPLGIACLGAHLQAAGVPVSLLDLSLKENFTLDVAALVARTQPDLVGLSATLFSLPESMELARSIRRAKPDVCLVLGGPATLFPGETLFSYLPEVDAFMVGEGEKAVVEMTFALQQGKSFAHIPGVIFRDQNQVRTNLPAAPLNMDDLLLPARHLLPQGRYTMHPPFARHAPITLIESARGCPYQCAFCSLPRNYRARSVDHVMTEVRHAIDTEGIREIHFVDPTFTADRDRTLALAEALAPLGLRFSFKTRVDLVDPEMLAALKKAGCYLISYGLEAFGEKDLAWLNKTVRGSSGETTLRRTHEAGIETIAYMLLGNPGETFATVFRSVKKLIDAHAGYALFSDLFPDPATPITREAVAMGRLTDQQINDFYFRQTPLPAWQTLAGLPARQVHRRVMAAFVLFYFSPRTLARMAQRPRNLKDLWNLFNAGLHLLSDIFFPGKTLATK